MTYSVKFSTGQSAEFPDIVELLWLRDNVYRLTMENKQRIVLINVVSMSKKREKRSF